MINPYLALESVRHMIHSGDLDMDPNTACQKFLKANLSGVIKTMSKMGISTIASYRGAQIFEAIGLNQSLIDRIFCNTSSRVEGVGIDDQYEAIASQICLCTRPERSLSLDPGGIYQWRANVIFQSYHYS